MRWESLGGRSCLEPVPRPIQSLDALLVQHLNTPDATTLEATSRRWTFTPVHFVFILTLFVVGCFPDVLSGRNSFFYRDFGLWAYPDAVFHRDCFWRTEIPLWNPYNNCGIPFLAQWNTLTLYPLSLIYLLLPLPWSLNIFCLFHLWLAGFGMYLLARRWTGNSFATAKSSPCPAKGRCWSSS